MLVLCKTFKNYNIYIVTEVRDIPDLVPTDHTASPEYPGLRPLRVNKDIKKSKKILCRLLNEHVNNITKTWEGIKKIVNIKKTSIKTTQLKIGGKIIDNDKEIATNFNKFFVNVGPNTENMIPKVPNLSPKFLKNSNQIVSLPMCLMRRCLIL